MSQAVIQPSRQWDYIYDPTYTLSGQRDHQRSEMKAYTTGDRIRKDVAFQTMFSCMRHFPSYKVRLQKTDPVPPFISRGWRGFPEANNAQQTKIAPQVSGRNRYKYFRRPNIPALSSLAYQDFDYQPSAGHQMKTPGSGQANVVTVGGISAVNGSRGLSGVEVGTEVKNKSEFQTPLLSTMKTTMTQTDYRESEAQTDPYSPDWILSNTEVDPPEIVTLMSLTYGAGLPAGPIEIELIERARARRKFEESLPPLSDGTPQALEKRRKMMAEAERKQWVWREKNLERLHKDRLDLLAQVLNERNDMKQEQTEERLDKLKLSQEAEAKRTVDKFRSEHIKAIRKLTKSSQKKMANVPDPNKHNHGKRDIIADYADCGSSAWAPLSRMGVFPDRHAEQNNIVNNENTTRYLSTLSGLIELESSLPRRVVDVMVTPPVAPSDYKSAGQTFVPRAFREQHELDEVYGMLLAQEAADKSGKKEIDPNQLRLLKKIERPQPRPITPTRTFDEQIDIVEQGALTIQRLLRGKAIQKQWHEGVERRKDLLAELRATKSLEEQEQQALDEREKAITMQQKIDSAESQKTEIVDSILYELIGETISNKFDFVSKEIIRLQEERRLHALSQLAERRRRMREAAESGRRQAEERRRREEDEIFKQILKVHQDTVDQFLADVVIKSSNKVAHDQARSEVEALADSVSKAAYLADQAIRAAEEEGNMIKAKQLISEISAELVHDFLIPEAARMHQREQEERGKEMSRTAAETVMDETIPEDE